MASIAEVGSAVQRQPKPEQPAQNDHRDEPELTLLPFWPLYGRVGRGSNPFEVEADYLTVR